MLRMFGNFTKSSELVAEAEKWEKCCWKLSETRRFVQNVKLLKTEEAMRKRSETPVMETDSGLVAGEIDKRWVKKPKPGKQFWVHYKGIFREWKKILVILTQRKNKSNFH